jgi:hypothetical protein
MNREETTRTCLTIRSGQLEALRGLSRQSGAPVSWLARTALDQFLARRVAGYSTEPRQPDHPAGEDGPLPSTTVS